MSKNNLPKIIIIVGPNASGKSDLGVKIAKYLEKLAPTLTHERGGEIISADSRQVYRGMDIGTGKITKKDMKGTPHYLLDVVSPKTDFNVFNFKKLAEKKIKEIIGRGRVPIIVGGTGFWIDALVYDFNLPPVKPDKKLRIRLEKLSASRLFQKLKKLDPVRAGKIDGKNKRRLVRALEIILSTKKPVEPLVKKTKYSLLILGVKKSKTELEKRIHGRLIKRLEAGMINEVKKLRQSGVSWERLDNFGLEYRYISRYLRKLMTYDEMVTELFRAIKNYAKRQMTWFKKNKETHWVDSDSKAEKKVKRFLKN